MIFIVAAHNTYACTHTKHAYIHDTCTTPTHTTAVQCAHAYIHTCTHTHAHVQAYTHTHTSTDRADPGFSERRGGSIGEG